MREGSIKYRLSDDGKFQYAEPGSREFSTACMFAIAYYLDGKWVTVKDIEERSPPTKDGNNVE